MSLPSPGTSLNGQNIYVLQVGVGIDGLVGVDVVTPVAADQTILYSGTNGTVQNLVYGGNTLAVGGNYGALQDSSAFTFTNAGTTYLVSNGPLTGLVDAGVNNEYIDVGLTNRLSTTQGQYVPPPSTPPTNLPVPGETLNGQNLYILQVGANVGGLVGVDVVTPLASDQAITYNGANGTVSSITYGSTTVNVGGNFGATQDPTAFTFTNNGTTYLVSNGPLTSLVDVGLGNEYVDVGLGNQLSTQQGQYSAPAAPPPTDLPVPGETLNGQNLYILQVGANVGGLVGVDVVTPLASDQAITYNGANGTVSSITYGSTTVNVGGNFGATQDPTAFTFTNNGTTYLVSNGPLTGLADVGLGNEYVDVGLGNQLSTQQGQYSAPSATPPTNLPVPGETLNGQNLYVLQVGVNALGLVGVDVVSPIAADQAITYNGTNGTVTSLTYGSSTLAVGGNFGATQDPTAFTFTNNGTTYLVSNGPLTGLLDVGASNDYVDVGLGNQLSTQQGQYSVPSGTPLTNLPTPGTTLDNQTVYTLQVGVNALGQVGVDVVSPIASDQTLVYSGTNGTVTSISYGTGTIAVGGNFGATQDPTAFTFTNNGTTYLVSNGPLTGLLDVGVGNEYVDAGLGAQLSTQQGQYSEPPATPPPTNLPTPGASIDGQYVYTLQLGVNALGLVNVALLNQVNGGQPVTYNGTAGTVQSISFGTTTIAVTGGFGATQDPSAFTFLDNGTTYLVSNGPIGNLLTVPLSTETVSVGLGTQLTSQQGQYAACYVAGTHILTPEGEVPVETLRAGGLIATASGLARTIKWIGRRSHVVANLLRPDIVMPICISRGAIKEDLPHRDLLVSPEHAIYLDGVLIPARHLVNGTTIAQVKERTTVDYFHVELESHDILIAEGLTAESWLDTGNRGMFENAAETVIHHPLFATTTAEHAWASDACAELVTEGPTLAAVRNKLIERAIALGAMTREPQVCLIANGAPVEPTFVDAGRYRFAIPPNTAAVAIASRSVDGGDAEGDRSEQRRLGVAVRAIILNEGTAGERHLALADPTFTDGFSYVEGDINACYRWTDGYAMVPLPGVTNRADDMTVTVEVVGVAVYAVGTAGNALRIAQRA